MVTLLLLAILLVLIFGGAAVAGFIKMGFIAFISIMAFAAVIIIGIIIYDTIKRKIRRNKWIKESNARRNKMFNGLHI